MSRAPDLKLAAMMTHMVVSAGQTEVTSEFVDLCRTLYGDVIDAQGVWDDVFKSGPDSSDVHVQRNTGPIDRGRMGMRALAITGGVVGGALGVREGRQGVHEAGHALKLGRSISGATRKKLAIGATLGVADSVDLGVLATEKIRRHPSVAQANRRAGRLVPVNKSVAAEVTAGARKMADGFKRLWNPAKSAPKPAAAGVPNATAATAKVASANNAKAAKNIAQGKDVGTMLSTTSGKAATGGLGLIGANKANKGIKNRKAGMEYVDDGMSKSDDVVFKGEFSKFDDDKHLAFGWASVVSKGGHPVIDKQGDYIAIDDIEKAAYSYVIKSRVGGDNHTRTGQTAFKASDMVESMVFTDDKVAKMGLPDNFPRGWWVGFKVHDENVWSEVRKGNRTGFSIHGKGIRKNQSVDEIMGYI